MPKREKKSKSQRIRDYFERKPDAPASEIAKAVGAQPSLVYQVKSVLKRGDRPSKRKAANSTDRLRIASELIIASGGVKEARRTIDEAAELARSLTRLV